MSPSGRLLAYGTRMPGGRTLRPIFIACISDGTWRTLGEDCGGRPREWVDERGVVIERFARLNSIALIDTNTGDQQELLKSAELRDREVKVADIQLREAETALAAAVKAACSEEKVVTAWAMTIGASSSTPHMTRSSSGRSS
ncbi:hypothetical protein B4Q13_16490 [Lacticaseibacillus rhamnosus]